jgi:hypothetical protein
MSRQEGHEYCTPAGGTVRTLPLTKLVSSVVTPSASGLCLLFPVFPARRVEVVPVLEV